MSSQGSHPNGIMSSQHYVIPRKAPLLCHPKEVASIMSSQGRRLSHSVIMSYKDIMSYKRKSPLAFCPGACRKEEQGCERPRPWGERMLCSVLFCSACVLRRCYVPFRSVLFCSACVLRRCMVQGNYQPKPESLTPKPFADIWSRGTTGCCLGSTWTRSGTGC